jgi:hypothetical protein
VSRLVVFAISLFMTKISKLLLKMMIRTSVANRQIEELLSESQVSRGCGVSEINKGLFMTEINLHLDADAEKLEKLGAGRNRALKFA